MTEAAVTPAIEDLDRHLSLSEAARRLGVPITSLQKAAQAGKIEIVGIDDSKSGRPAKLTTMRLAQAWKDRRDQAARDRRSFADRMDEQRAQDRAAGIPLPGTTITGPQLCAKYGVSSPLLSYWKRTGKVTPVRVGTSKWEPDVYDESAVFPVVGEYLAKKSRELRASMGMVGLPSAQEVLDNAPPAPPGASDLPIPPLLRDAARRRNRQPTVQPRRRAGARDRVRITVNGDAVPGYSKARIRVTCPDCGNIIEADFDTFGVTVDLDLSQLRPADRPT